MRYGDEDGLDLVYNPKGELILRSGEKILFKDTNVFLRIFQGWKYYGSEKVFEAVSPGNLYLTSQRLVYLSPRQAMGVVGDKSMVMVSTVEHSSKTIMDYFFLKIWEIMGAQKKKSGLEKAVDVNIYVLSKEDEEELTISAALPTDSRLMSRLLCKEIEDIQIMKKHLDFYKKYVSWLYGKKKKLVVTKIAPPSEEEDETEEDWEEEDELIEEYEETSPPIEAGLKEKISEEIIQGLGGQSGTSSETGVDESGEEEAPKFEDKPSKPKGPEKAVPRVSEDGTRPMDKGKPSVEKEKKEALPGKKDTFIEFHCPKCRNPIYVPGDRREYPYQVVCWSCGKKGTLKGITNGRQVSREVVFKARKKRFREARQKKMENARKKQKEEVKGPKETKQEEEKPRKRKTTDVSKQKEEIERAMKAGTTEEAKGKEDIEKPRADKTTPEDKEKDEGASILGDIKALEKEMADVLESEKMTDEEEKKKIIEEDLQIRTRPPAEEKKAETAEDKRKERGEERKKKEEKERKEREEERRKKKEKEGKERGEERKKKKEKEGKEREEERRKKKEKERKEREEERRKKKEKERKEREEEKERRKKKEEEGDEDEIDIDGLLSEVSEAIDNISSEDEEGEEGEEEGKGKDTEQEEEEEEEEEGKDTEEEGDEEGEGENEEGEGDEEGRKGLPDNVCRYCGKELKNAKGRKIHERTCDEK